MAQNVIAIVIVVAFVSTSLGSSIEMWYRFAIKDKLTFVVINYTGYYVCYYTVILMAIQFAHIVHNIEQRIKK